MVKIPDEWWCGHGVLSEEESWHEVSVVCEKCGKRIPFNEWKNSRDGITGS